MGAVVLGRGGGVVDAQPGLLGQFPRRRLGEVLVGPYEAAGQGPAPLERRFPLRTASAHRELRRTVSTTRSTVTAKGGKADGS